VRLLDELVSLEELLRPDALVSLEERMRFEEPVSLDVSWPDGPFQPRAFIAAQVAVVSTPPCDPQAPLALLAELEPSLQTTVSIALIRMCRRWWTRPLSPAEGPVWTPGSALSVVSVGAP
jgi:hypothetical protein